MQVLYVIINNFHYTGWQWRQVRRLLLSHSLSLAIFSNVSYGFDGKLTDALVVFGSDFDSVFVNELVATRHSSRLDGLVGTAGLLRSPIHHPLFGFARFAQFAGKLAAEIHCRTLAQGDFDSPGLNC